MRLQKNAMISPLLFIQHNSHNIRTQMELWQAPSMSNRRLTTTTKRCSHLHRWVLNRCEPSIFDKTGHIRTDLLTPYIRV